MNIPLQTRRLLIRQVTAEDEEGFYELDTNPEVHRYLGNKPSATIEQVIDTIEFIRRQYIDNGIARWTLIERDTNSFVGWAGLKLITEKTNGLVNYYDLGYRLSQQHWGKGFTTEAAEAVLDYGFNEWGLNEIFAIADSKNESSKKVLQKLGFRFIEVFDYDGIMHNWYKLDKSEWTARKLNN